MVESLVEIKDDSLEEILEEGRRKKGFFFFFFFVCVCVCVGVRNKHTYIHTRKSE